MRNLRLLLALAAAAAAAVVVSACGSGLPADAVAKVGDSTITKARFDHWLHVAAASTAAGRSPVVVPDPPDYASCIRALRAQQPKPAKGQPPTTDRQLRTQCANEYGQLRNQVMQFLIFADWVQGEAAQRNITVSDKTVTQQIQQAKKQDPTLNQTIRREGLTQQDLRFRIRLNALSNKLRDRVTGGSRKVSQAQIQRYYSTHLSQFSQPERRDLRIVLTKTRGQALAARRALSSGRSFKAVAKQYSTDPQTKSTGGVLLGVIRGQQEPGFDQAVFSAPKGKLTGPVKTQFGFYVFTVTKITKGTRETLAQATPTIRQILVAQRQQQSLNAFVKSFSKEWKAKTQCRQGYVISNCANAPTPKKGSSTTSTG